MLLAEVTRLAHPASVRPRRVLLSTTSSDAHTWNLVFLQLLLEDSGHEVVNLGPCVPDDLLLATARTMRPDAIIVSSVNGLAGVDGPHAARAIRSCPETREIPMIIGGKLGISPGARDGTVSALIAAGYDSVFADEADPESLLGELGQLAGRRDAAGARGA